MRYRLMTAALAVGLVCASAGGQPYSRVPVSIGIAPGRTISPEEARAPAYLLDGKGQLIVVDQLRGFLLGRFATPPGLGSGAGQALGGAVLDQSVIEGPPLPPIPLTPLRLQYGFPYMADGAVAGSPCVADLNGDGRCEIVLATTEGSVTLLEADSRVGDGWPLFVSDGFYAPPAAGDLDGDGELEIVLGGISGRVYAWNVDGTRVPGWPVRPPLPEAFPERRSAGAIEFYGAAAVADLDGDGLAEVVVPAAQGLVWVLEADGLTRAGWPHSLPPSASPPNPASVFASPALTDLDGDGRPEIVLADNAGRVHAWRSDGRSVPGWPVRMPNGARCGFGDVATGDLDGDGTPEVVVTTEHGADGPALVALLGPDGLMKPGWPFELPEPSNAGPALGDINGDGVPEIVVVTVGGDAAVIALDVVTARPLPGWPVRLRAETINAPPLITDVDDDGGNDVIVAALSTGLESDAWIWAIDASGRQLRDFPVMLPQDEIIRAAPVTADVDADGDLELLAATERLNTLYVWDLDALCDPASMPWPGAAGSASRCACLETVQPAIGFTSPRGSGRAPSARAQGTASDAEERPASDVPLVPPPDASWTIRGLEPDASGGPPSGGAAVGSGAGSDGMPAGTIATIDFELAASTQVLLVIFDITGAPIRTLLDTVLPPGGYSIRWDGRNDAGQTQPSGIYHFRLTLDERARTQQLLLLK